MEKGDEVLVVMILSQLEFELHHIPDSVNIPIDKLDRSDRFTQCPSRARYT